MLNKIGLAKKIAVEKFVQKGLEYGFEDPENNLPRMVNWAKKIARDDMYIEALEKFEELLEEKPVIFEYARRFENFDQTFRENFLDLFIVQETLLGTSYREEKGKEIGANIPYTILLDPTSACNLNCEGCWAGKYDNSQSLEFDTIDRIITEAKELGIHFFVLSGGEPTVYPHLFDIFEKHHDCAFMMYTNGTLIDEDMADKILKAGNISPCISLEGFEGETEQRRGKGTTGKIEKAMKLLKERGIIFGSSITVTRDNCDILLESDKFVEDLIDRGVLYTWLFHYVPIGKDPNLDLMLTAEQRKKLAKRSSELRWRYPIFLADFWNDGHLTNGCIAGGDRYFHINANGDVEPCAFVHFAVDNIKNKSLKEILKNPLFTEYQKRIPFSDNMLRPCPIIDVPEELQKMVSTTEARPTHPGADDIFQPEIANKLKRKSQNWQNKSQTITSRQTCKRV
ncbi:radical SAM protein [Halarsenatibacter silvermanii]|uniref:Radical SAM additional 4Fe4S-binding SPASM domain-containing protein n=1 Tax=Halarsenatibacter silvermanii TaxID=321763 RepID=A0A1G9RXH4_9FIRM|nr:radical SAM protein [Halarsenatibacter silvermanii]SDM27921.1 radical SAM additional 4Fe4S-binding SPASM domain-containing protein [Halarsenatibacter silvermanii]